MNEIAVSFMEASKSGKKIKPIVPNYNPHYFSEWIQKYFPRMKYDTVLSLINSKWIIVE